jgi:hypothetical protein
MQNIISTSFFTTLSCLLLCSLGCDQAEDGDEAADEETGNDTDDTDDGEETEGPITNACGTFEQNEAGDSVFPQDPDDPEIITACTALCEAQAAGIEGCTTEASACLESCKMRSCDICPDTLAPLVDCETSMFTGEGCTCGAEGIDCPVPEGCAELEQNITQCGG